MPPGGPVISLPLLGGSGGLIFDVEFPSLPSFCVEGEYSPVEVRQCRSIEGVLGECELLALVSSSGETLGQSCDQMMMSSFPSDRVW